MLCSFASLICDLAICCAVWPLLCRFFAICAVWLAAVVFGHVLRSMTARWPRYGQILLLKKQRLFSVAAIEYG